MSVISKALSGVLEVLTEPKPVFAGKKRPVIESLNPESVFEVQEVFPGLWFYDFLAQKI